MLLSGIHFSFFFIRSDSEFPSGREENHFFFFRLPKEFPECRLVSYDVFFFLIFATSEEAFFCSPMRHFIYHQDL